NVNVTAPGTPNAGPFTNSATVSGGGEPPANTANNSATDPVSFAIVGAPAMDLDIDNVPPPATPNGLTHTGNFIAGIANTYTLRIDNIGAVGAAAGAWGFIITPSPTNLTFGASPTGFNCTGTTIWTCTSTTATIAAGGNLVVTIPV